MTEMIPFKETRLYKWPATAFSALRKNPIDTGIAMTFAGVFILWAVWEAWGTSKPLTAFADSWGDFGGSIIGGLVAFMLARLAMRREREAQLQRYVQESGRHAVEVRERIANWRGYVMPHFEQLKVALGQEMHEDSSYHYDRKAASHLFHQFTAPEKFGAECVGRLTSLWPLESVEATINREAQRLSNFGHNVWVHEGKDQGSYEGETDDLSDAFDLYEWCMKAVDAIDAAMAEMAAGRVPARPSMPDVPSLNWPRPGL